MRTLRPTRVPRAIGVTKAALATAVLITLALALTAHATDSTWPRAFDSAAGSFVIYQPQPEDLTGDVLMGRAAFSLQKNSGDNPIFGVLWFTEHILIDRDSSTVVPRDFDVTKVRMPGITPAEAARYERLVETEAARWDLSGSIEELKAGLASAESERASVANLDDAPPIIRFAHQRSILVVYDGAPQLEPIAGTNLERVSNTPYAVIHDPANGSYYLSGASLWYQATSPLGPWYDIANPPRAVAEVVPPDTSSDARYDGPPPAVLTATAPTELISIDGEPEYAPLVGDELLYVTNTESDVIREVRTQRIYVLIAGRWYRAPSPDGPWEFVRGDALPPSFARVPIDSPKGHILASVAGTDQADDAVADAEIPQTSAIRRDGAFFEATYDGPAQFEPIDGTDLEFAVNTDAEVIYDGLRYYACDQGVWFVAGTPYGPWLVSDVRPVGIDDIPPGCPVYDVRYVYIYDSTPDAVYVGYLPGYIGSYPHDGCVVYGTGYRYKGWRGHHHYYPGPWTWGCLPRYNPWLSRWSFGYSYGSGFLRIAVRWESAMRAARAPYARRWFGSGGFHRPWIARNFAMIRSRADRPVSRTADPTPTNIYRRSRNVVRVDPVASRKAMIPIASAWPRQPRKPNDVFAGKDGKVYRRDTVGNWKVNDGRTWRPTTVPTTPLPTPSLAPSLAPSLTPPPQRPSNGAAGSAWNRDRQSARPQPVREPVAPSAPREEKREEKVWPPSPRASAPPVRSEPGDLEREFRGRERAGNGGGISRPAPDPPQQSRPSRQAPDPPPSRPQQQAPAPQPAPRQQ